MSRYYLDSDATFLGLLQAVTAVEDLERPLHVRQIAVREDVLVGTCTRCLRRDDFLGFGSACGRGMSFACTAVPSGPFTQCCQWLLSSPCHVGAWSKCSSFPTN